MKRYIATLALTAAGVLGVVGLFASTGSADAGPGCVCVDCRCPDCNGEFCTCNEACACSECGCAS